MHITLKQLEIFLAVAKNSNISNASNAIGLTQSACSISLSTLENQLGGPLFDRVGKKILLNDRGKFLLPMAMNCLNQAQEIQDKMHPKRAFGGELKIGASTTIGNYVLPPIIAKFCQQFEESKVRIIISNTAEVIENILNFSVDLGLIEGNCHIEQIEALPWRKDQLVIVTHPNNPLAQKSKVSRQDLLASQWILREIGSGTRQKFEEAIGVSIRPFLELGDSQAIKQLLMSGIGVSCLSQEIVINELKAGKLVALDNIIKKIPRNYYILLHKNKYKTLLLQKFIKSLNAGI